MKKTLLKIIYAFLRLEARIVLAVKKPKIIAVTGSIGKTTTKDAIYWILKDNYFVSKSPGNLNAELGVPLTILGYKKEEAPGRLALIFLPIWGKIRMIINLFSKYPEVIIIEMGIENKGDIKYFINLAKPHIAVVTSIGPVHLELFKDIKGVYNEKADIVRGLSKNDFAVLNKIDKQVAKMADETRAKVKYFSADPIDIAKEAARAVGKIMGASDQKVSERLKSFKMPKQRMNIIKVKNVTIVDDSYNSNPLATSAALGKIDKMKAKRKIAILGDMLELGSFEEEGHNQVGQIAGKICDQLIFVGQNGEYFEKGASKNLDPKNIIKVGDADEALKKIKDIIMPGDLILIKGSRKIGLEIVTQGLKKGE